MSARVSKKGIELEYKLSGVLALCLVSLVGLGIFAPGVLNTLLAVMFLSMCYFLLLSFTASPISLFIGAVVVYKYKGGLGLFWTLLLFSILLVFLNIGFYNDIEGFKDTWDFWSRTSVELNKTINCKSDFFRIGCNTTQ